MIPLDGWPVASWSILWDVFLHFALLSMLAVGGAVTLAPEMHRYMVDQTGLLTDMQFTSSIAIAQAAPGPNLLFVTIMGWQIGGPLGALATTVGIVAPAAALVLTVNRISHAHSDAIWVRSTKEGLAPIAIALMLSTAWILSEPWIFEGRTGLIAGVIVAALITFFTRVQPVLLILAGGLAGGFGLI